MQLWSIVWKLYVQHSLNCVFSAGCVQCWVCGVVRFYEQVHPFFFLLPVEYKSTAAVARILPDRGIFRCSWGFFASEGVAIAMHNASFHEVPLALIRTRQGRMAR